MLMRIISVATLPLAVCLEAWLAVLIYRREAYKLAPVFFSYIVISVPVSLVRAFVPEHRRELQGAYYLGCF